jgi:hypothetical protein
LPGDEDLGAFLLIQIPEEGRLGQEDCADHGAETLP